MRSARSFSCRALSSPDMYSTRRSGMRSTVCSTSVLFPMPGSPPSNTSDPGTSPPPNTRFSSSSCMSMRGSSPVAISFSVSGRAFSKVNPGAARLSVAAGRSTCSFIEFHVPHEGHRPAHLGESYPHSVHTYAIFSFAIYFIYLARS